MKPVKTTFFKSAIIFIGWTILVLGVGAGIPVASGEERSAANENSSEKVKSGSTFKLPVYKPPKGIGAPGGRIGGATRGQDAFAIFALVPDHLGLTINEQPTLYWYLSESVSYPLVLTVNEVTQVEPIVETIITKTPKAGIHSFPLKKFNIKLALDKEYQWFVSLALDHENPSKNIIAGGRIQRVLPPESLLQQLRNAEPDQVTAIYSDAGLWYDALASISDLIESSPNDSEYRMGRKKLLEQVDLMDVINAEENLNLSQDSLYWKDPKTSSIIANFPYETEKVN